MPETMLHVRVQPRASKNEVLGWREGTLTLRLTAPPVDGAANAACRDFLAEILGVRRGDVELLSGERSRDKRFRISGLDGAAVRERIDRATLRLKPGG